MKAIGRVDLFEGTKIVGRAVGSIFGVTERIISADAAGRDQTQVAQMVGGVDIGDADSQQCGLAGVKAQHVSAWAAADFGDKGRKVVLDGGFAFVEDSPLAAGEMFGHTVEIGQRHMGKLAVWVVAKGDDPTIGVEDELVLFVGVPDVVAGFVALGQPVFGQWGLIDRPQHFALGQLGQIGADGGPIGRRPCVCVRRTGGRGLCGIARGQRRRNEHAQHAEYSHNQSPDLPVERRGVNNLANHLHGNLSRKPELGPDRLTTEAMQVVLTKGACLSGPATDTLASRVRLFILRCSVSAWRAGV